MLVVNIGPEVAKLLKLLYCSLTAKCGIWAECPKMQKNVQSNKCSKQHFQRVAN